MLSVTEAITLTDAACNDVVFTRAALKHAAHAYGVQPVAIVVAIGLLKKHKCKWKK